MANNEIAEEESTWEERGIDIGGLEEKRVTEKEKQLLAVELQHLQEER